ncbi:hypothetical protein HH214_19260 [Mucilaginibacter robiniae]|uniref:Viral A-type inclusion protein n=1 Tax=Mucilaginibacter robiniae TaxID=2728022 RepID=A0A7L5EAC2_9SPHI|nr:hypothetical protein [Mucilaginibacter robiniae]QJD97863.1 hypothetical protein HH214_19260 [Mucilaginibacter robiniae]
MKYIKVLTISVLTSLILISCQDNKKQETDLLDGILKMHDKVMADDEAVMKNKILLDSLLKTKQIPENSATVFQTVQELDHANEAMENWMHQFNADYAGKPHDEIMQYLTDQKKKLSAVDMQLDKAVKNSNTYLSTIKK